MYPLCFVKSNERFNTIILAMIVVPQRNKCYYVTKLSALCKFYYYFHDKIDVESNVRYSFFVWSSAFLQSEHNINKHLPSF